MAKKGGAHGMTEIGIERSYLKILRKAAKKGNNIARAWLNRDKDNSYQLLKKKIDKCYNKKIGASYKGGKCIICGYTVEGESFCNDCYVELTEGKEGE